MAGTNWTNITTFESLLTEANRYSPFWGMMLFMVVSVFMITFLPFGFPVAVMVSCFIGLIIGIFLAFMGLVAWKWVIGLFAGLIITILIEALTSKKDQ
jgi:hypothetical protein